TLRHRPPPGAACPRIWSDSTSALPPSSISAKPSGAARALPGGLRPRRRTFRPGAREPRLRDRVSRPRQSRRPRRAESVPGRDEQPVDAPPFLLVGLPALVGGATPLGGAPGPR